ncbi:MAG: hypothetical protein NVSMB23_20790 [Myxococcales bacterium]
MVSPRNASGTITSTEVRQLLRTAADRLSAREEKALRMAHTAPLKGDALRDPLPRRGQQHPEARTELLALEIELQQKLALRAAAEAPREAEPRTRAQPTRTKEKDKIIRALRRLK